MTKAASSSRLRGAMAIAGLVLLASPGAAHAQGFLSPLIGYDFGGDSGCPQATGCDDKNLNIGVSVGSLGAVFGTELEFAHARDFFGDIPGVSSSVLTLMGNAMLAPRFGAVRPYGLMGLGLVKTRVEFSAAGLLETDNNHFGWDAGGGLMIFLGRRVGVRGDIRYFHAFQDFELLGLSLGETKLNFGRVAAGVVFTF